MFGRCLIAVKQQGICKKKLVLRRGIWSKSQLRTRRSSRLQGVYNKNVIQVLRFRTPTPIIILL
jgi:hypothetical protein